MQRIRWSSVLKMFLHLSKSSLAPAYWEDILPDRALKRDIDRQKDCEWFSQVFLPLHEQAVSILRNVEVVPSFLSPSPSAEQEGLEKLPRLLQLLQRGSQSVQIISIINAIKERLERGW